MAKGAAKSGGAKKSSSNKSGKAKTKGKSGTKTARNGKKASDKKANTEYKTKPGESKTDYSTMPKNGQDPKHTKGNQIGELERKTLRSKSEAEIRELHPELSTSEIYNIFYGRSERKPVSLKEYKARKRHTDYNKKHGVYDYRGKWDNADSLDSHLEKTGENSNIEYEIDAEGDRIYFDTSDGKPDNTVKPMKKLIEKLKDYLKGAPKDPEGGEKIKGMFSDIPWYAKFFLWDNTIGNYFVHRQNNSSLDEIKKDPGKEISFIIMGRGCTRGAGYETGKAEIEEGRLPVHLKSYNHLKNKALQHKLIMGQIQDFYKEAGITDVKTRNDGFIGHSTGSNVVRYEITVKDVLKTGVKAALGIAGTPAGGKIKKDFKYQILDAVWGMQDEAIDTSKEARKTALFFANTRPLTDYEVIINRNDTLIDSIKSGIDLQVPSEKHHLDNDSTHVQNISRYSIALTHSRIFTEQKKKLTNMPLTHHIDINENYEKKVA